MYAVLMQLQDENAHLYRVVQKRFHRVRERTQSTRIVKINHKRESFQAFLTWFEK